MTSELAKFRPEQDRRHQDGQCNHGKDQREVDLNAEPARLHHRIFGHAGIGLLDLFDNAGIELSRHVKKRIVKGAQANQSRDIVLFGENCDFGFILVDVVQKARWRRRECQRNTGLGAFQDVTILVDQHCPGQITRRRARRQKLPEGLAILIIERPGMGDIIRHPDDIAANELSVFVQIGPRNTLRILDHLACRAGKQPVEAAFDRNVGDDRHEHGRQHRHDREQADHLNVEPCRGPVTAYIPSGGRSRASSTRTACSARGWLTTSPLTTTRSGETRTPKSTAFRNARMFSDGVPTWKSDRCRMLRPSPAPVGGRRPAPGECGRARDCHDAVVQPKLVCGYRHAEADVMDMDVNAIHQGIPFAALPRRGRASSSATRRCARSRGSAGAGASKPGAKPSKPKSLSTRPEPGPIRSHPWRVWPLP